MIPRSVLCRTSKTAGQKNKGGKQVGDSRVSVIRTYEYESKKRKRKTPRNSSPTQARVE